MGSGIDAARAAGAGIHADVMDDFKDQIVIVLLRRLAKDGVVEVPMAEVDDTAGWLVSLSVNDGVFRFLVHRKS